VNGIHEVAGSILASSTKTTRKLRNRLGRHRGRSLAFLTLLSLGAGAAAADPSGAAPPAARLFFEAASQDEKVARPAIEALSRSWRNGYAGMVVDLARLFGGPRRTVSSDVEAFGGAVRDDGGPETAPGSSSPPFSPPSAPRLMEPSAMVRSRLIRLLEKQTGQRFGDDLRAWRRWIWAQPYEPHPELLFFKAALYSNVDPRLAEFFVPGSRSLIRLDEVDWGGVKVNGIPPLENPKRIPAAEAKYLKDDHVVFGVALNGEARAYPKRILAWHELALDTLGGTELAIVYCTLCGTVIPYGSQVGGQKRTFGTSGLLYRSNKLLFDHESRSLWSTVEGRPVIGPLAGSGLELTAYPVVTTTWREWREAHPETTVLDRNTGFERDYSEGAAYRGYFATDTLMFEVPRTDKRLKNKAEVLTLLTPHAVAGSAPVEARRPLALSAQFLRDHPLHHQSFAGRELFVLTTANGANRVYESAGVRFVRRAADGRLVDSRGLPWRVSEEALESESDGRRLPRIPARRAFWFGWFAQFPETELVR
jgi:hypothetical protein